MYFYFKNKSTYILLLASTARMEQNLSSVIMKQIKFQKTEYSRNTVNLKLIDTLISQFGTVWYLLNSSLNLLQKLLDLNSYRTINSINRVYI